MRILTIVAELTLAGTARAAYNFSTACAEMGHNVAVLNWRASGPRRDSFVRSGIPVFGPENSHERLMHLALEFRPDVIHIHRRGWARKAETEILLRLRKSGRPVLETNVFGCVDWSSGSELIDVHLQLSGWCMWRWRRCHGGRPEHTPAAVVPYPVDIEHFKRVSDSSIAAFRKESALPDDAYVCGRAGFPREPKWHPSVVSAFRCLAEREPRAFMLLAEPPPSVREAVKRLPPGVRERVRLLDLITSDAELCRFYSSLDCFLHHARIGESFGFVLAEAMLCNCPVIAVNQPLRDNSQLEVVGHLDGGIIAGNAADFGAASIHLWSDPTLRAQLAQRARSRIVRRYSAANVAAKFLRVAELALSLPDRVALGEALLADASMQAVVPDDSIMDTCRKTFGRTSASELNLSFLLHRPPVHRAHMAYRGFRCE